VTHKFPGKKIEYFVPDRDDLSAHGVAGLEDHFSSRSLTEIGIQVTVDLTHENAAILMTEPVGYLPEGNSAHHAHRSEVMPHVVKSNPSAALIPTLSCGAVGHEAIESHG